MRGSASRPHPTIWPTHRLEGCAAAAALVTECLVTVAAVHIPTTGPCAAGSARPPHFSAWRLGCPLGLWPPSPVTRAYRSTILVVIQNRTQQGAAPPPILRYRSLPRGLRLRSAPPGRLWSATALRACSLRSHSLPAPHLRAIVTVAAIHTPITGPCAAGSGRVPHFSAWPLARPLGLWPPPSCACSGAHSPSEDGGAPATALLLRGRGQTRPGTAGNGGPTGASLRTGRHILTRSHAERT